jgi:hypothetical protein
MKDINPPSRRRPKYVPQYRRKKHPHDFWIKIILGLGTLAVAWILSQLFMSLKPNG